MDQKTFNQKIVNLIRTPNSVDQVEIVSQFRLGSKLSPHNALGVYQEDYQARLTEALKNTYRAIHFIIGDDDFFHLASDYIKIYSSNFSNLDNYGNHLSFFLTTHPLSDEYIILPELANFEWLYREVFHLKQDEGLDGEALKNLLTIDQAFVKMVNSTRVLNYNYMISDLFNLKDKTHSDEEAQLDFDKPQHLLMSKNGTQVKTYILTINQWIIIQKFVTGCNIQDIFNTTLTAITPDEIQSLFQILGGERLLLQY
ncbi:MAG: putative DNA-binding domain-containing protein [Bacteriovorax sp.]|nr:putative DNA-binding domain-containing protein [Bacteriovorax sp.]